jgi:hypothetical protein
MLTRSEYVVAETPDGARSKGATTTVGFSQMNILETARLANSKLIIRIRKEI